MRKAVIISAVVVAMAVSIAVAGIFGPLIVSAALELLSYKSKTKKL